MFSLPLLAGRTKPCVQVRRRGACGGHGTQRCGEAHAVRRAGRQRRALRQNRRFQFEPDSHLFALGARPKPKHAAQGRGGHGAGAAPCRRGAAAGARSFARFPGLAITRSLCLVRTYCALVAAQPHPAEPGCWAHRGGRATGPGPGPRGQAHLAHRLRRAPSSKRATTLRKGRGAVKPHWAPISRSTCPSTSAGAVPAGRAVTLGVRGRARRPQGGRHRRARPLTTGPLLPRAPRRLRRPAPAPAPGQRRRRGRLPGLRRRALADQPVGRRVARAVRAGASAGAGLCRPHAAARTAHRAGDRRGARPRQRPDLLARAGHGRGGLAGPSVLHQPAGAGWWPLGGRCGGGAWHVLQALLSSGACTIICRWPCST